MNKITLAPVPATAGDPPSRSPIIHMHEVTTMKTKGIAIFLLLTAVSLACTSPVHPGADGADITAESVSLASSLASDAKKQLRIEITTEACSGKYKAVKLHNKHVSMKIRAKIETISTHLGKSTSSTKEVVVRGGDSVQLGCTGWANPAGFDTTYKYKLLLAWKE